MNENIDDTVLPAVASSSSVLLRHEVAGEGTHFDWLIETEPGDEPDDRTLLTFRLPSDPRVTQDLRAERLPAHRRRYLVYEGDIGGGRGTVRRVWSGVASIRGDRVELVVDGSRAIFTARPLGGGGWHFLRIA